MTFLPEHRRRLSQRGAFCVVSGNVTPGLTLAPMMKTLAQVVYSDLSEAEMSAVTAYLGDNSMNYEYSDSDLTWIRILNPTPSELTGLEVNVFGGAV